MYGVCIGVTWKLFDFRDDAESSGEDTNVELG